MDKTTASLAAGDITELLLNERPLAMDKRYHECSQWERGACDEWNTIVLSFAGMLFPMRSIPRRRQAWINALCSDDKMAAFELANNLEEDIPQ